jgi:serine/threonine protein kinase
MQRATRGRRARRGANPGEASMAPTAPNRRGATRPHPTLLGIGPRALPGVQPLAMPFAIDGSRAQGRASTDGSRAQGRASTGEVLAEQKSYQVMALIGASERTLVVEALDRESARVVALKCLRPEIAADPAAAEHFLEHARNNLALESDHIARVHEVGRLADGTPFLSMDRLRGCDLRGLLDDAGALLIKRASALGLQICEGLAAAHALGFVHGGLKPENIIVSREGAGERLELLEFGTSCQALSQVWLARGDALPAHAAARRAPSYSPPELRRGSGALDARSDIWSLGCVLFEMLAGRAPQFGLRKGQDGVTREAPIVPLRSLRPELPSALAAVIARCVAESPAQRFQDVAELARALVPFAPPAASAHAERCAELLEREPERVSGVRRVLRELEVLPTPGERMLEEPRSSWLGPLALVLCVPVVSALGWLYAALPLTALPGPAPVPALPEQPADDPAATAGALPEQRNPGPASAAQTELSADEPANAAREGPVEVGAGADDAASRLSGPAAEIERPTDEPATAPAVAQQALGGATKRRPRPAAPRRAVRASAALAAASPAQPPIPVGPFPFKPDPYGAEETETEADTEVAAPAP